jgi:hypothetical protein
MHGNNQTSGGILHDLWMDRRWEQGPYCRREHLQSCGKGATRAVEGRECTDESRAVVVHSETSCIVLHAHDTMMV